MRILESSEDYLEAMLMMQERFGYIRSIDIANELNVTKPSVSYATKRLRQNGYITMDKERVYERHKTLSSFFMKLGVDEETALEDACKVEHDLSEQTYEAIKRHALSARK